VAGQDYTIQAIVGVHDVMDEKARDAIWHSFLSEVASIARRHDVSLTTVGEWERSEGGDQ
jgi:hypothetical protein